MSYSWDFRLWCWCTGFLVFHLSYFSFYGILLQGRVQQPTWRSENCFIMGNCLLTANVHWSWGFCLSCGYLFFIGSAFNIQASVTASSMSEHDQNSDDSQAGYMHSGGWEGHSWYYISVRIGLFLWVWQHPFVPSHMLFHFLKLMLLIWCCCISGGCSAESDHDLFNLGKSNWCYG